MKSRLFVVNNDTLQEAKTSCIAKVMVPLKIKKTKKRIRRTIPAGFVNSLNSMMADLLQIDLGDYIFFWCEKDENSYKSTITGVYRVVSKPYFLFDNDQDIAPFKIRIEEAYHFDNYITEYDVLNSPAVKTLMWNIQGKKVSGKSRGNIQITPDEAKTLLSLLISKNSHYTFTKEDKNRFTNNSNVFANGVCLPLPLKVDLSKRGTKLSCPNIKNLSSFNIYEYVHLKKNGSLYAEKTLEGLFNQEIVNRNKTFFDQLDINVNKIIWFGNYLPYSLDATEMDYLLICSEDGENPCEAYVVEFKVGNINKIKEDTHFYRAMLYSKWANENLFNGANITTPLIICEKCPDFNNPKPKEVEVVGFYNKLEEDHSYFGVKRVKISTIEFKGEQPKFNWKRK